MRREGGTWVRGSNVAQNLAKPRMMLKRMATVTGRAGRRVAGESEGDCY